jgi:hypothetical protein
MHLAVWILQWMFLLWIAGRLAGQNLAVPRVVDVPQLEVWLQ